MLEDLLSLENLNLAGNRISFITKKSFPSSPWVPYKLKHVNVSYNLLESIVNYEGLGTVHQLDLSHNHIRKLIPGVFGNFTSLKHLDLSFNRITSIDVHSFSQKEIPNLGTRSDHGSDPPLPPPALESLDLVNNRITMVEPQELLALNTLKSINLNGNPLSDLPCIPSIIARMARKGLSIKYKLISSSSNQTSIDGDVNYCNNWLARNFKVQSSLKLSSLKLVTNPITSATIKIPSMSMHLIPLISALKFSLSL